MVVYAACEICAGFVVERNCFVSMLLWELILRTFLLELVISFVNKLLFETDI